LAEPKKQINNATTVHIRIKVSKNSRRGVHLRQGHSSLFCFAQSLI
jgi:hypothetical protein